MEIKNWNKMNPLEKRCALLNLSEKITEENFSRRLRHTEEEEVQVMLWDPNKNRFALHNGIIYLVIEDEDTENHFEFEYIFIIKEIGKKKVRAVDIQSKKIEQI